MKRQLNTQDASYLYLETEETPAHVGGLDLVELPADYKGCFADDYRSLIASRLHLIPLLYSRLEHAPFDLDWPSWVDAENVDLDYHVRRAALPAPGTMEQLEELLARLHGGLLDRTRPLWEFYVIEGLQNRQIAIYTKIHHAAMDGASSQGLVATMYDVAPGPRTFPPLAPPAPFAKTGRVRGLVRHVLRRVAREEILALRAIPELLRVGAYYLLPDDETLRFRRWPSTPRTPRSPFNVGITNQRTFAARTMSLRAFKHVGHETGTTVNDVVLAISSAALRRYLDEERALPARSLTAMVPVAMSEGDAAGKTANHNAAFLCSLSTDIADPVERLLAIHRTASEQRKRIDLVKNVPVPMVPWIGGQKTLGPLVDLYGHTRLAEHLHFAGNVTISNIPGPRVPLYVAGAKLVSLYPMSIAYHGAALNITVQSYVDRLDFGLVACRRAVPQIHRIADHLVSAFAELERAVAARAPASPPERGPTAREATSHANGAS